jgi:hypothetical protein
MTTPVSSTTPPQDDRITPPGRSIPPAFKRLPSNPLEDHTSNWIPPDDNSSPPPSNQIHTEHDRTTPPLDWIPTDDDEIPTDDDEIPTDDDEISTDNDEITPQDNRITPPFNRITPTMPQDNNMIDEDKNMNISAGTCTQNNSTSRIRPQVNMLHADSINTTNGTFIQNNAFGGE